MVFIDLVGFFRLESLSPFEGEAGREEGFSVKSRKSEGFCNFPDFFRVFKESLRIQSSFDFHENRQPGCDGDFFGGEGDGIFR